MARTATRDVELNGQQIEEGQKLLLLYPSANRDEDVFDDPFTFDIDAATPNDHVAFGFGSHFCLGNSLARLELQVMFDRLLEPPARPRAGRAEAEPAYRAANFVSGYESMPVRFTPAPKLAVERYALPGADFGLGGLLGPAVVGLAGRRARTSVDDDEVLRQLVAGQRGRGSARAARRASGRRAGSAGCTTAVTALPHRSSGTPTTSTSSTAGWPCRTASTSSGKTFSPPVLMHCDPRPSSWIVPSASTVAMSPVKHLAPAVDLDEGLGRLLRVVVVAERDAARRSATRPITPEPGSTGVQVVVEHRRCRRRR